jgi:hypothetical protein
MFDHHLYKGRVKSQYKNVWGSIDTYVYELGGGLHAGVKGLDLFQLGIDVYGRCHISANVISSQDKVWNVPQGPCNTRVLSRLFHQLVVHHEPQV